MPTPSKRPLPKTLWEQYAELQNLREQILAMEQKRDLRLDAEPLSDNQENETASEISVAGTKCTGLAFSFTRTRLVRFQ
jgi:hypothetical protein